MLRPAQEPDHLNTLSPQSRSRSVGFDRNTVKQLLQEAGADAMQAHLQGVTVSPEERAALQLVSQGSIPSASRRVSRSREPPDGLDRHRPHQRASTATATDMQTGAPSLDFQIT